MTTASRLTTALADRYRIERELGQGGMATVYLAEDVRHKRRVAVKVLHAELSAVLGPERFLKEIELTASLQHAHILPLFDSGSAGGQLFYVMPFVEGETLRARLERESQLPVAEAVRLASEVADALSYAHGRGIVHRDIKPENILLQGGHALVADFGIALAVQQAGGQRMTQTGLSLGTPQYMAPEQAMGEKAVDARADVYALGAVTYEMLAGDPPFTGPTAQAIVAKVITEKPTPIAQLRDSVPANVDAALARALAKLPADRFESSAAFARALADPGFHSGGSMAAAADRAPVWQGWKRTAIACAVVAAGLAAVSGWALVHSDTTPTDIGLPPNAPIQMAGQFRTYAVSHDGSFVVYLARIGDGTQLWYRSLRGTDLHPVPGTDGAGGTPRLSPDGKRVVFQAAGELKLATLTGGAVTTIGRTQDPHGGEWLPDGRLFFGDNDGRLLRWINPDAGTVRELTITYCVNPQLIGTERVLCGGGADHFAFIVRLDRPDERTPLRASKEARANGSTVLVGSHFRVIDGRYLIYMSVDGTLMGTSVAGDSLIFGRSVPLVPMVRRSSYSGVGQFDIADNGTLTYVPGINADIGRLVRVGRDGRTEPLPLGEGAYLRFTPSPDGRRLATVAQGLKQQELEVFDLGGGTHELVDSAFYIGAPAWSPDGKALAYRKSEDPDEESLLLRHLDSPDRPTTLVSNRPPQALQVSSWLAADSLLVGRLTSKGGALIVDPTHTPARIDSLGLPTFFVSLSPDRRWIAYQSPGVTGVHLAPWPKRDRHYLVDAEGTEPRWASSTELIYLSQYRAAGVIAASVYRARIAPNAISPVAGRDLVVRDPRFADTPGWSTAATPSGEVIYLQSPSENLGYYVRVIPGWVARMKRVVDAANP